MVLIDAGLVMYVGLGVLFVWRSFFAWKCCGRGLVYLNYCSLLLVLIFVILAYDSFYFIKVALTDEGKSSWDSMPAWLRPWMLASPSICLVTYIMSALQTFQHMEEIREDRAVLYHDRAVQIILLPAVYGVMGLSSMTRMYSYIGTEAAALAGASHHSKQEVLHRSLSRSQTCFWVGDLYEAWALFQFGRLTCEVVAAKIVSRRRMKAVGDEDAEVPSEKDIAVSFALEIQHKAVESLTWLGILSFLLVCVAEAGASLWLLTFQTRMSAKAFDDAMNQFTIAGFLASAAAIYNVFIVEESYHSFLEHYSPRVKFITVKVLVTFAFFQRGCFKILMYMANMLPASARATFDKIPVLGELINFPPAQFELFYGALIITECFLVCVAHQWAWSSKEIWYSEADDYDNEDSLIQKEVAEYGADKSV